MPENVTTLVPMADRLGLVRCPACGLEWHDIDAATHQDGYSEKGCPNECGRLTDPVYAYDIAAQKWRRTNRNGEFA